MASPVAHALSIRDLRFGYGRRPAVRGVSFDLAPGEVLGFLGHNGAGKTTVLRLCLGLLRPSAGRIEVFGVDALAEPRRARAAIGALIERPGFRNAATARANLLALARLQGQPRRLAQASAGEALERLGLGAVADRRVGTFSLGMRQRLGIAQALLGRPRLLLLDEPTNGLDPDGIADLRALLRSLAREDGVAVLLSSHQLSELDGLCSQIAVLREGELVLAGPVVGLRARLQPRHIVAGTPLPALAARLRELGTAPAIDGDRLLVDLGGRAPGEVVRALTAVGDLAAFHPEPITLEDLYRRAAALRDQGPLPNDAAAPAAALAPALPLARWRALRHELTSSRPALWLLALPPLVAVASVFRQHAAVAAALAKVAAGQTFSAAAGSGHLALVHALQQALPVLAVVALWHGSQAIAADLGRDTLRNTLQRAVTRGDVLFGKLGAAMATTLTTFALTVAAAAIAAGGWFGFGDFEEVTRHGDRQALASAADTAPVVWQAILHTVLPLLAMSALGTFASVLARRPARAVAGALLLAGLPELARPTLGERAGWLVQSHLPLGVRDDSALAWAAALCRGAADAYWPYADTSVLAPAAWLAGAGLATTLAFRRLRVP